MRDDGLFYPDDINAAVSHCLGFLGELNALYAVQLTLPDFEERACWSALQPESPQHADVRATVEGYLGEIGARRFSHDADVLPYRLFGIALGLTEAITRGELDVALEAYESFLAMIAGKPVDSTAVWKHFFWPQQTEG